MSMFGLKGHENNPTDEALPEHLRAAYTGYWLELVARIKMPAPRKAVAVMLATFSNTDGSEVRPALGKVADMAGLHETGARAHVKALVSLGMLAVKREGGGRGNPTVYRLTRPADITTLPLWLDPSMDRVPAGAGFIPLAAQTVAPAVGNTATSNTDSLVPAVGNAPETVAPALGNRPVDNSGIDVNGSDPRPKPQRFVTEKVAPALPDLTKTRPEDLTPLLLPQVSTSPVAEIHEKPQAIGSLVGEAEPNPWTPDVEPPAPRIVSGSAGLAPADGAHAAALAVLAALPGGARFFAGRAVRLLADEGVQDPSPSAVAIRAAELARRTHSESRTA